MYKMIITSEKFEGSLEIEMDGKGVIKSLLNNASMTEEQILYLAQNFPMTMGMIRQIAEKSTKLKVKFIQADLSFEAFWNEYSYKHGNKSKCEKLWNALPEAEKLEVLESIPKYKSWIRRTGIATVYPERYISNQRYKENFAA